MKKVPYYFTISICSLLIFFGCSTEDNPIIEEQVIERSSTPFLSKSSTDRLAKDLLFNTDDFLLTLDVEEFKKSKKFLSNKDIVGPYDPEDPTGPATPPDQTTFLRYELTRYWIENQDILIKLSNELGLENAITVRQMVDYSESLHFSLTDPESENMEQLINDSPILNSIQKKYALELWNASISNDADTLIEIIERLSKDVKRYPELEIFNSAISAIDMLTNNTLQKGSLQQRCPWYHPCGKQIDEEDCLNQDLAWSAAIAGVGGMVSGAVTGGTVGFSIGAIFGGFPAIPAGGAGAVAGAVFGGVSGFTTGIIYGYIACATSPSNNS